MLVEHNSAEVPVTPHQPQAVDTPSSKRPRTEVQPNTPKAAAGHTAMSAQHQMTELRIVLARTPCRRSPASAPCTWPQLSLYACCSPRRTSTELCLQQEHADQRAKIKEALQAVLQHGDATLLRPQLEASGRTTPAP